ncbi:uncharacterized protein ASCRUDRAFT_69221 [Ascoidea rubescens DSM 1968]|uniref:Uncharacterized protein n=1 Tax=Ascoidea rubescens DSM 1968 TaxID=1344418 RepID=A0A1D2VLE7_9ASCO|nr:hypothetical protein ASCRUDRAFT_69221 [Ascoidea rubescens DSM 1968]ODV62415.1 hypothetical protein ASCRUDRAFT_69221 [Ascoidea rubescens DSM 1968]
MSAPNSPEKNLNLLSNEVDTSTQPNNDDSVNDIISSVQDNEQNEDQNEYQNKDQDQSFQLNLNDNAESNLENQQENKTSFAIDSQPNSPIQPPFSPYLSISSSSSSSNKSFIQIDQNDLKPDPDTSNKYTLSISPSPSPLPTPAFLSTDPIQNQTTDLPNKKRKIDEINNNNNNNDTTTNNDNNNTATITYTKTINIPKENENENENNKVINNEVNDFNENNTDEENDTYASDDYLTKHSSQIKWPPSFINYWLDLLNLRIKQMKLNTTPDDFNSTLQLIQLKTNEIGFNINNLFLHENEPNDIKILQNLINTFSQKPHFKNLNLENLKLQDLNQLLLEYNHDHKIWLKVYQLKGLKYNTSLYKFELNLESLENESTINKKLTGEYIVKLQSLIKIKHICSKKTSLIYKFHNLIYTEVTKDFKNKNNSIITNSQSAKKQKIQENSNSSNQQPTQDQLDNNKEKLRNKALEKQRIKKEKLEKEKLENEKIERERIENEKQYQQTQRQEERNNANLSTNDQNLNRNVEELEENDSESDFSNQLANNTYQPSLRRRTQRQNSNIHYEEKDREIEVIDIDIDDDESKPVQYEPIYSPPYVAPTRGKTRSKARGKTKGGRSRGRGRRTYIKYSREPFETEEPPSNRAQENLNNGYQPQSYSTNVPNTDPNDYTIGNKSTGNSNYNQPADNNFINDSNANQYNNDNMQAASPTDIPKLTTTILDSQENKANDASIDKKELLTQIIKERLKMEEKVIDVYLDFVTDIFINGKINKEEYLKAFRYGTIYKEVSRDEKLLYYRSFVKLFQKNESAGVRFLQSL